MPSPSTPATRSLDTASPRQPPVPTGGSPSRRRRWRRRAPQNHWGVFGLVLIGLLLALFLQGYGRDEIGKSSTTSAGSQVVGLAGAGPIVDLSGPDVRSVLPHPAQIALTFDDGPDPTWTPRIVGLLRHQHVPATFFVVGSHVLTHPGLVKAELASGDDVGSHTFTHSDLGSVSGLQADFELGLTQTSLAGAAGITTSLLRLPYSSVPADVTVSQLQAAKRASHLGYLVAFASRDSEDWKRPGVTRILSNALPPDGQGAVIMFHDGGGNRAETVAAVGRLVKTLKGRGDQFVTVSQMAGLPHAAADRSIDLGARLQGLGLLWAMRLSVALTDALTAILISVAALAILRAFVVVGLARRHARGNHRSDGRPQHSVVSPPVSVIVPAYNEEVTIAATVASLEASAYPSFEVIVVDDGSTDGTASVVRRMVSRGSAPHTRLIRQVNGGKPAALNAGIAEADHDLLAMVDADTTFEPGTLSALVGPMDDPTVGAVSGNTKVANRRRLLGLWQHIEYVIGFNLDRRMYAVLHCIPTVPGAVGLFRRQAVRRAGGLSDDTLAEDTDLTMAIHRAGWQVVYQETALAWTEAPGTLKALWSQRYRWCYGTIQATWKHRRALREGAALGRVGIPYLLLFQVLLPLAAPLVDVFALYGLVFLNPVPVVAYWVVFNILQLGLGILAFRLDHERPRSLWALPLQQFVYRQLMYLVVIQSVISAFEGWRLRWQKLDRTGAGMEDQVPQRARSRSTVN